MGSGESSFRQDSGWIGEKSAGAPRSPFGGASESGGVSRWPRLLVWGWVVVFWALVFTEPIGAAGWFIATVALAVAWLLKGEKRDDRT